MTSAPEPSHREGDVLAKRLRVVRVAVIATLLLFCVPVPPWEWVDGFVPFLILVSSPPFLMILWRLRKGPRKDGLALAAGTGGILVVPSGLLLLAAMSGRGEGWGTFAFLMLFTTVQVILAGGAIAAYKLVGYAKGDWKLLARGVVDPLVYFGLIAVLVLGSSPYLAERRARRDPVEAMVWMAKLHECAAAYASGHPAQGFPARLDLLGPEGTKCIEPLSGQNERSGYVFSYTPTAPEASGKIPGYVVTARPSDRVRPGRKSFYLDATGTIRATTEDRPATPQDPVVQ
jgi:hypothetical protein